MSTTMRCRFAQINKTSAHSVRRKQTAYTTWELSMRRLVEGVQVTGPISCRNRCH